MITELGVMGVKPNLNIMDDATPEGQILPRLYKTVTTAPGGPYRVYWGLEIEAPLKLWAFFDFDSVEQHEKFAKDIDKEIFKDLPKILTKGYFTKHVAVTPSPPLVLLSPVTEIMLAYFPSDISKGAKEAASVRFRQFVEKGLNKCDDVKGFRETEAFKANVDLLTGMEGLVKLDMVHIKCRTVERKKE